MTLILAESWTGDGTNQVNYIGPGKWTSIGGEWGFTASLGRNGLNGVRGGIGTPAANRALGAAEEDDYLVVGIAVSFDFVGEGTEHLLQLMSDSGATTHLTATTTDTGSVIIRRGTGSGTIIAETDDNVLVSEHFHFIEVEARLSDSTSDLHVYVDGVERTLSPAGPYDTKNAGTKTVFDFVKLVQGAHNPPSGRIIGEVYILNEQGSVNNSPLGDVRIEVLRPNGNGNSSQLLGSDGNSTDNYLLVDEATHNDADYVGSATDNQKDTYAYSNLSATAGDVAAVQVVTRALKSDSGAKSIANISRSGANETDAADRGLSQSATPYGDIYETKPGGGAWTISDVNAMEAGVKVRP